MKKYIFSQGQVFADQDAYRPILKKLVNASKFSVLLIIRENRKAQSPVENEANVQNKEQ